MAAARESRFRVGRSRDVPARPASSHRTQSAGRFVAAGAHCSEERARQDRRHHVVAWEVVRVLCGRSHDPCAMYVASRLSLAAPSRQETRLAGYAIVRSEGERTGCSGLSRIDESIVFVPVRIAVLTVSDTRDASNDTSGDTLAKRIDDAGHVLAARTLIRDDKDNIRTQLQKWIDDPQIDAIIT